MGRSVEEEEKGTIRHDTVLAGGFKEGEHPRGSLKFPFCFHFLFGTSRRRHHFETNYPRLLFISLSCRHYYIRSLAVAGLCNVEVEERTTLRVSGSVSTTRRTERKHRIFSSRFRKCLVHKKRRRSFVVVVAVASRFAAAASVQ